MRAVVHVSPREVEAGHQFVRASRGRGKPAVVITDQGARLVLPHELIGLFSSLLEGLLVGRSMRVERLPSELTTTQAAAILGVSRPTVVKRIKEGRLPATKIGTHHRLNTRDVLNARMEMERQERRRGTGTRRPAAN